MVAAFSGATTATGAGGVRLSGGLSSIGVVLLVIRQILLQGAGWRFSDQAGEIVPELTNNTAEDAVQGRVAGLIRRELLYSAAILS
jgi:hypothetical protein